MSGVTVKVLEEVSEPIGVDVVVSPENDAVNVYELEGSPGVMTQVAVPVASVSAVQVSEPLRVKVTGSLTIGALVAESGQHGRDRRGRGEVARDGLDGEGGGCRPRRQWATPPPRSGRPPTDRRGSPELRVDGLEHVAAGDVDLPDVARVASPVQNEVPSGVEAEGEELPWQPGRDRARVGLDHVAVGVEQQTSAIRVRHEHVPVGQDLQFEGCGVP